MKASVLVAGIGNIFQGDDAFGVAVIQRLSQNMPTKNVQIMDVGIRSIDLAFALLENPTLTILVDATSRGGAPGTLYTIEIDPKEIPDVCEERSLVNTHSLDPVRVLALAKSMGAHFGRILLVGCEPLALDHDDTGHIGLSDVVEAAVDPAIETICRLVDEFEITLTEEEEVCHECK